MCWGLSGKKTIAFIPTKTKMEEFNGSDSIGGWNWQTKLWVGMRPFLRLKKLDISSDHFFHRCFMTYFIYMIFYNLVVKEVLRASDRNTIELENQSDSYWDKSKQRVLYQNKTKYWVKNLFIMDVMNQQKTFNYKMYNSQQMYSHQKINTQINMP